jgi:dienelactone hydrolase
MRTTSVSAREREVRVPVHGGAVAGTLAVPDGARGIVIFAHGSGSSRRSPRNRHVARALHEARLATLLMDLLTAREEEVDLRTGELRFDIGKLAERLVAATDWSRHEPETAQLHVGYFGASTGAAAALVAAAQRPMLARAVVSRGGRPDLAGASLAAVRAPTLLIVGGHDEMVLDLNRMALAQLHTVKRLEVVPGATHLFEEPGALEAVAHLARRTALPDYALLSVIIYVHAQVGGNLAVVLDSVARTVRERIDVRQHALAVTAQQRLASRVLSLLPLGLLLFLAVTDRPFVEPLFTMTVGRLLLGVAGVLLLCGWIALRSFSRVEL